MANYPKITGNTNSKLNRINSTNFPLINETTGGVNNSTSFLKKKLIDNEGVEFIYGVVVIESNGDAGSVLNISQITLKDADDNIVIDADNTDVVQQNLFVLSPKKQTGANQYATSGDPFMGTSNADFSNTQIHTFETVGVASIDDNSTGASTYLGVSISGAGVIDFLDASTATASSGANTTAFIPLYRPSYIIANPIPQGEYAAMLIKCDPRLVTVDGVQDFKLIIGHNGVNENGVAQNYELVLRMTGDNVFGITTAYNDDAFVNAQTLPLRTSIMSKISDDPFTGLSWTSQVVSAVYPFTTASSLSSGFGATAFSNPQIDGVGYDEVTAPQQVLSYIDNFASDDFNTDAYTNPTNINNMITFNGNLFEGDKITISDSTTFPSKFRVQIEDSSGFSNNIISTNFLGTFSPFFDEGATATIRIEHTSSSTFWINGTMDVDATTGNFLNFVDSDAANQKTANYIITTEAQDGDKIIVRADQPHLVYPLFTYPQQTLDFHNSTMNAGSTAYSVTSSTPFSEQFVEHARDTIQFFEGNNSTSIFTVNPIYETSFGDSLSTQTTSHHNVRINCLSSKDQLDFNLIAADHTNSTSVTVRLASSETGLNKSGSSITQTDVPTAGDKKKDYTVEMNNDVESARANEFLLRQNDGQYQGVDSFRGFASNTLTLKAPVTAWKPGYYSAVDYGALKIPYFISDAGPAVKELRVNHSFYLTRPLFCVGYEDIDRGISCEAITQFEFLGPKGDSSYLYTTDFTSATGLKEFQAGVYRETTRSLLVGNESNLITHRFDFDAANSVGADRNSYQNGNEVFNINDSVAFSGVTERVFLSEVTSGAPNNQTTFKLVTASGAAVNSNTAVVDGDYVGDFDFTLVIGKPLYSVNQRKLDFVHDTQGTNGLLKEYDRVNCSYGSDISYEIPNLDGTKIVPQDTFYVESDSVFLDALHAGATTDVKKTYTANNTISSNNVGGQVTIYNFDPKEKGLLNNNTEISSIRNFNEVLKADVYNANAIDLIYVSLSSLDLNTSNNSFEASFPLSPFNAGDEDIIMIGCEIFDPYYLPEGAFTLKPAGSNEPTWSIIASQTNSSGGANLFGGSTVLLDGSQKPSDTINGTTVGDDGTQAGGSVTRLQKSDILSTGLYEGLNQALVQVDFSVVTNGNVAGDYYKAVEFSYYRDAAYSQKRFANTAETTTEVRPYADRPIWKTRKLIKVSIAAETKISVTDTDITPFNVNSTVDFGEISIG